MHLLIGLLLDTIGVGHGPPRQQQQQQQAASISVLLRRNTDGSTQQAGVNSSGSSVNMKNNATSTTYVSQNHNEDDYVQYPLQPYGKTFQWVCILSGVLFGGVITVLIVNWCCHKVMMTMSGSSSSTTIFVAVIIVLSIAVLVGPEILPPITPLNGCEDLRYRLLWTVMFGCVGYYDFHQIDDSRVHPNLLLKILWTVSGIWHIYRSDIDHQLYTMSLMRHIHQLQSSGQNEKIEECIYNSVSRHAIHYFRSGTGIGMMIISHEQLHSWTLLWCMLGFFLFTNIWFYMITDNHDDHHDHHHNHDHDHRD
jgi:hypothetical protein